MIREAVPDDWAEWRDLRLAALRDAPDAFSATLTDWLDAPEQRWRDRLDGTFNVFADLDGRAAGMATGFPRADAVELGTLWVAPHARGRGIGESLVRAIMTWAEPKPVTLQVAEDNHHAVRLYRRLGLLSSRTPR
ncbi:Ribosomal protein S18 acetylase RimI [Amycolatopsis pretoriensis]|uniref:Ribosomal protein S18 acetylase RimI n=1 Tax=Amycolatopsis pretoriensis TaxID=218821 RepID=A0A1H5QRQ2_9PSEU|nr:GNAT family N-acetyltransferase [Amycolatopsis pretoriensis]SEF28504.1 Ribosomal protein S18 acetylase RimI [Amycolatopsis pretoriensis]